MSSLKQLSSKFLLLLQVTRLNLRINETQLLQIELLRAGINLQKPIKVTSRLIIVVHKPISLRSPIKHLHIIRLVLQHGSRMLQHLIVLAQEQLTLNKIPQNHQLLLIELIPFRFSGLIPSKKQKKNSKKPNRAENPILLSHQLLQKRNSRIIFIECHRVVLLRIKSITLFLQLGNILDSFSIIHRP